MLRKCTLKIFFRVPKYRIMSRISRPGSLGISDTMPFYGAGDAYGDPSTEIWVNQQGSLTKYVRLCVHEAERTGASRPFARWYPRNRRRLGRAHSGSW